MLNRMSSYMDTRGERSITVGVPTIMLGVPAIIVGVSPSRTLYIIVIIITIKTTNRS